MKDASSDWFDSCVSHLTSEGSLRVWSVLVTIFGDLAQNKSDQISGSLITALTSLVGIKAEATRVALHRLRKEGWIESTRVGRASVHRLTEYGRNQSAAAAPRIYARETSKPEIWHVLVSSNSETSRKELADQLLTGEYVSVNPVTAMASGPMPDDLEELLGFETSAISVPEWLRELFGPEPLKTAYDDFWKSVRIIDELLPQTGVDDPMKTAVLRILVVHNWRRIILRHPVLPAYFLPADWKGPACREEVSRLLDRLPRPHLATLEAELNT
ncbi:PaaX family transcriptional regulator C-terminal domain-containing protein [Ruegeria arenilitoris]|uniref:PaaX family transcriptional regulator C-terminal domain-containing protein n=1 Tax=Ruegeria arenilitoris TaxID=1173585 RepID=UPI00147FDA3E|nr:PaaX family transcriptional regulator C-terminal domain-containing protein [Ruegeria arenilitoris]